MAFGDKIKVRIRQVEEGTNARKKKLAGATLRAFVSITPIKTGRAKAGWRASRNQPSRSFALRTDYEQTLQQGLTVIKRALPRDTVYLSNNVPYITELDRGSSLQAPTGIVDNGIALGQQLAGPGAKVFR